MYLTRIELFMTRGNTLWKYLELTLSSYPLPGLGAQLLPNAEMVLGMHYVVLIEGAVAPITL